jgi:hypothetical protein
MFIAIPYEIWQHDGKYFEGSPEANKHLQRLENPKPLLYSINLKATQTTLEATEYFL